MPTYKDYEAQAVDIIQRTDEEFKEGHFALTSGGTQSALFLDIWHKSGVDRPVITLDSGKRFPETNAYQNTLQSRFGFELITYGPNQEELAELDTSRLNLSEEELEKLSAEERADIEWRRAEYNRITKLDPLSRAIGELGVQALESGIVGHQTDHRSTLSTYGIGRDGEWRIHPVLDWPAKIVDEHYTVNNLPQHPLKELGYDSVGDQILTRPGVGREGRGLGGKSECGLHVPVLA